MAKPKSILRRFGPGLITASVVLGPGSIVAASNAGATVRYGLLWVFICAGIFMATFTAMAARLGCALDTTPLEEVARRYGRWLAVLAGFSGFFVCAGFQFGNNLGVSDAVRGLVGGPKWLWPIVFTALSVGFLFGAKNLYRLLERIMMALVGTMIVAFLANLCWTGVNPPGVFAGLVPRIGQLDKAGVLTASAMLATTFSVVAAFYQAYLVRAKGWTRADLPTAISDAWIGIAILVCISAVIMFGAAETLGRTGQTVRTIGQLAEQLHFLGPVASLVFCSGLAAAAFSSFVVNAMVGGNLLADGLGLDARIDSAPTKLLAAAALLAGCAVALVTQRFTSGSLTSLLVAQASTLVAAPLAGVVLLLLTSSKAVMGDLRNRAASLAVGVAGLLVIFALLCRSGTRLVETLSNLLRA